MKNVKILLNIKLKIKNILKKDPVNNIVISSLNNFQINTDRERKKVMLSNKCTQSQMNTKFISKGF